MWCPFDHTRLLLLLQAEGEETEFVFASKSKGNAQTITSFRCCASQSLLISLSHFPDHNENLLYAVILHEAVSNFVLSLCMTLIFHFLSTDHLSAHLRNKKIQVKSENHLLANIA